jgi:starvation-inducible DNA-binding protein
LPLRGRVTGARQGEQIFAMTDDIAERASQDRRHHARLKDNNDEFVLPKEMLSELRSDNLHLTRSLRATHEICDQHKDMASASLIETWIDEAERRTWFLTETVRRL